MPEPDPLTDIRERIVDLQQQFRAVVLPLLTTTGQLGERQIAMQQAVEDLKQAFHDERDDWRGDRHDLWEQVDELKQRPQLEQQQKRTRRERLADAIVAAVVGAIAGSSGVGVISLITGAATAPHH